MKNSPENLKKPHHRNFIRSRIYALFEVNQDGKSRLFFRWRTGFFQNSLICGMMLYCFPWGYFFQSVKKAEILSINVQMSIQLFNPIIATPYLIKKNDDQFLLSVADVGGNVYGVSLPQGTIDFTYKMPGPVVAPLSGTDCDNDNVPEVLVSDQLGNYIFLDINGDFLYKNRHYGGGYFSKSLILNTKGVTIFSDIVGEIHSINNSYGKVLWKFKFSSENSFYSAPVFIQKNDNLNGIFMSKDGTYLLLDLSTGIAVNRRKLTGNFLSSPCIGNFLENLNETQCVLVSTDGVIFLLDVASGEILQEISLQKKVVGTPIAVRIPGKKIQELVVSTQNNATVCRVNFKEKKVYNVFGHASYDKVIRSTPVLLDFNADGTQDILVVTGDGTVHTFDMLGEKIYEDFFLGTEVTATPLFFKKENKNFGVFCGENGIVYVLHFPQRGSSISTFFVKKNALLYAEFLGDATNQNVPKYYRTK